MSITTASPAASVDRGPARLGLATRAFAVPAHPPSDYLYHIRRQKTRGQSTVEFALVVPVLLILFVAVADMGRIFATGVVIEAAARDAAEVVAEDYLRNPPGDPALTAAQRLASPAPNPGTPAYYNDLQLKGATTVCVEARDLPNTTYQSTDGTCPSWPVVRVCVHDGVTNNSCGDPITGFSASVPVECDQIPQAGDPAWNPAMTGVTEPSRYVEVRVCYPFTTLLSTSILPFTRVSIQRARTFTIACFQDPNANGGNC